MRCLGGNRLFMGSNEMTDQQKIEKLEHENYMLKVELKLQRERADRWEGAYDTAMNYAKEMLKRGGCYETE